MANPVPEEHVEAARSGDARAVSRLVETVWPDAYRLAFGILGERSAAEDAAQEACIILCRTLSSLRGTGAFRVWFSRIVIREASRIKRRHAPAEPLPETAAASPDQATSIDLWRALATLPQKLREAVVLRYFEDFSSREIAEILHVPDGTVRFRLMLARRRLRPLLGIDHDETSQPNPEVRTHAV